MYADDHPQDARADRRRWRRPGEIQARCLRMLALQGPARASPPRSSTRPPRSSSARRAPSPSFKGYRGFPGSICASPNSMVVHGIPGPYELQARRHPLDRRRRHQRRLGRRRRDHGRRSARSTPRPSSCSTPPRTRSSPASSRARPATTSATSPHAIQRAVERDGPLDHPHPGRPRRSAATCTRTRRSRTSASPARARSWRRGWCWRSSRWSTPAAPTVRMGDDGWAVYSAGRLAGRPLRVHRRGHRGRPAHPHPLARVRLARGPALPDINPPVRRWGAASSNRQG